MKEKKPTKPFVPYVFRVPAEVVVAVANWYLADINASHASRDYKIGGLRFAQQFGISLPCEWDDFVIVCNNVQLAMTEDYNQLDSVQQQVLREFLMHYAVLADAIDPDNLKVLGIQHVMVQKED